jgi:hypothetical protein
LENPTPAQKLLYDSVRDNSEIYLTNRVEKVDIDEIYTNPLWFHKNFIAANKPCIIEGATEGSEIC